MEEANEIQETKANNKITERRRKSPQEKKEKEKRKSANQPTNEQNIDKQTNKTKITVKDEKDHDEIVAKSSNPWKS